MDRKLLQSLAGWAITRSDQEIYRKLLDVLAEIIPTLPESIDVDIPVVEQAAPEPKMRDELPIPDVFGSSVLVDYYNAVTQTYRQSRHKKAYSGQLLAQESTDTKGMRFSQSKRFLTQRRGGSG